MARGYDKDFLVDAYMSRYVCMPHIPIETLCTLEENASKYYDKVGKDEFRVYASLDDAAAIKRYKAL